ncbi:hypothetical protein TNCV_3549131 [Trichonephila clavipes]|nr:hypothetical protein TNCV_3549131 [Trichonephila clavipes]
MLKITQAPFFPFVKKLLTRELFDKTPNVSNLIFPIGEIQVWMKKSEGIPIKAEQLIGISTELTDKQEQVLNPGSILASVQRVHRTRAAKARGGRV